jgi:hypothetical protein
MAASTPKKTAGKKVPAKKKTPVPSPAVAQPSSVAQFREKMVGHLLTLPSGNTVELRRPGISEFMGSGIIPDSVTPIVTEMIAQGERRSPAQRAAAERKFAEKMKAAVSDPKQIEDMMRAMERIAAASWISPVLVFHQREVVSEDGKTTWEIIPRSERDEVNFLYTDEISQEDIQMTFSFVSGGVGDVERFRQQTGASVAAVRGGPNLEVPSE